MVRPARQCSIKLFRLLYCLFSIHLFTRGQDLQFECISCSDKREKCHLDCSYQLMIMGGNSSLAKSCLDQCDDIYGDVACIDSDVTLDCQACTLTCSQSYDQNLRRCLLAVSDSTKASYESFLSECPSYAAFDMDNCMKHCSSQDGSTKLL